MTRRKSKPLQLNEIISNFYSSQGYPDLAPASSLSESESSQQQSSSSQEPIANTQTTVESVLQENGEEKVADAAAETPQMDPGKAPMSETLLEAKDVQKSSHVMASDMAAIPELSCADSVDRAADIVTSMSQTVPRKRRPGYFANRRSASFIVHDEVIGAQSSALSQHNPSESLLKDTRSSLPLKRTSSLIKLSLSLDGKAEVTTRTGDTPSPPHSQPHPIKDVSPRPNTGLQRSHSALEPYHKSVQTTSSIPLPSRPMTGRSRDSRTWEFYCDSDARNALTEQAEREESGSATAAINLIRTNSRKKQIVASMSTKRSAYGQNHESTKRLRADGQKASKPKLERASSSVARMQSTANTAQKQHVGNATHKKSKSASQNDMFLYADGDSDKENWEPGTQTRIHRKRKPKHPHQPARILEENLHVPSQSTSLDALLQRKSSVLVCSETKAAGKKGKENSDPVTNDETTAPVSESVSREVEDLDCVHNLLSLSQASWQ